MAVSISSGGLLNFKGYNSLRKHTYWPTSRTKQTDTLLKCCSTTGNGGPRGRIADPFRGAACLRCDHSQDKAHVEWLWRTAPFKLCFQKECVRWGSAEQSEPLFVWLCLSPNLIILPANTMLRYGIVLLYFLKARFWKHGSSYCVLIKPTLKGQLFTQKSLQRQRNSWVWNLLCRTASFPQFGKEVPHISLQ